MKRDDVIVVKSEITFFMEKIFQFSYAYLAAILAVAAGSKLEITKEAAGVLGSSTGAIVTIIIMLLNLLYLILATSCSFAVLKRGYFILLSRGGDTGCMLRQWEAFLRSKKCPFGFFSWNIDNYYYVAVCVLAVMLTLTLFVYAICQSHGIVKFLLISVFVLHSVPMWTQVQVAKLVRICNSECEKVTSQSALEPPSRS